MRGIDKDRVKLGSSGLAVEIEDFDASYGILKIADKKVRKYSRSLFSAVELRRELKDRLLA